MICNILKINTDLYSVFWAIPWCLNYVPTVWNILSVPHSYEVLTPTTKIEQCYETSEYIIQTPGNYPKESMTFRSWRKFEINNKYRFVLHAVLTDWIFITEMYFPLLM
jgi:hypothetical protein